MTVNKQDILRTAWLMIQRYQSKAEQEANTRMQYFINHDDAKGAGLWLAVSHEINILQKQKKQGRHLRLCVIQS